MKPEIITIGSATRDIFLRPEGVHIKDGNAVICRKLMAFEYGAKIGIERLEYHPGGTAVNVAIGLVREGIRAGCGAVVGDDESGREVLAALEQEKVETEWMQEAVGRETDQSVIILDKKTGERTIFTYKRAGKSLELAAERLDAPALYISSLRWGWREKLAQLEELAKKTNKRLFFTPGSSQVRAGMKELSGFLGRVEVIFMNLDEALEFTGKKNEVPVEQLAEEIAAQGPRVVIITEGAKGVHVFGKDQLISVPSKKVEAVDATGAGDAFVSGFLGVYLKNQEGLEEGLLRQAAEKGIEKAVAVIGRIGSW